MDTAKINFGQNATNVEVTAKTDAAAQKHLQELMKNMRKADFDSFQKSAITTSEACGCYPNYQITTGMPKSVFADQFGYEMQKEIASHMRDYYSGKVSDDERNEYFNQCCSDMRNYCTKQCRTTGTNEAANKQIIGQVYEIFAKENQRAARNANYEEGKAVNDSLANKYRDDDLSDDTLSGNFGKRMREKIKDSMSAYYAGDKTEEEIKSIFDDCCKEVMTYRTRMLETSGQDKEYNQKIISDVFEYFSKENQRAALHANCEEGVELNKEYYDSNVCQLREGFSYYNSDYYYKCEDMREMFREAANDTAKEWGLSKIDLKAVEDNTQYSLDGELDFNSGWNWYYRNNRRTGSLIEEGMTPPENFTLYFNSSQGEKNFNGRIKIESNGNAIEKDVPFSNTKQDIFNVYELVQVHDDNKERADKLNGFLKNFEIFKESYATGQSIYAVRGNYQHKKLPDKN